MYVKEPAPDRDPDLAGLVETMRRDATTFHSFATPGELAELLIDDLAALVSARFGRQAPRLDLPVGWLGRVRRERRMHPDARGLRNTPRK